MSESTGNGPLVRIRNLDRCFETGGGTIEVLKGLDLDIAEGDRIAIVGQSGVGKSTLLHILGTLDHPTSGTLQFRGVDVFDRSREALAELRGQFLGFVFQFHHLLPEFSSIENVMMPGLIQGIDPSEMRVRAETILIDVGLAHRVDQAVGKLSGGERQRVAVARALVLDPPLILADEPTGNLDPDLTIEIMDLIASASTRGTTVIVATHDLSLIQRYGKRTIRLEHGRIADDTPGVGDAP